MELAGKCQQTKYMPYDAQIEYLESTGTQFIKIPGGYGTWTHDIQFTSAAANRRNLMGYSLNVWWGTNSADDPVFYAATAHINVPAMDRNIAKFTYDIHATRPGFVLVTLEVDSKVVSYPWEQAFDLSEYYVFSINKDYYCYAKLFSLKFEGVDGLKYDFIPVRKDGKGYLYDKISGQFFGNNGTGEFVLGPDVKGSF